MTIEPLEPRRLLHAGGEHPDIIEIPGTPGDDVITITIADNHMNAVVNGQGSFVESPLRLFIWAGGGNDRITVIVDNPRTTSVRVYGASGNDTITGSIGPDRIVAGGGDDLVIGGNGIDSIYGEAGDDSLRGNAHGDLLDGGDGRDTLRGDDGDDSCDGGAKSDSVIGGAGDDSLCGGPSGDFLFGQDGEDDISGDLGNDECHGGAGEDLIVGNDGADRLYGEADADQFPDLAVGERCDYTPGADYASFDSRATSDSVLVMYTWGGDADLSGELNGDDYFFIDSDAVGYYDGSFDYSGEINGDDYFIIDSNITFK
jgi:Ca2+-binding RTX toxin-like protein